MSPGEETWEDFTVIQRQYLELNLEDKVLVHRERYVMGQAVKMAKTMVEANPKEEIGKSSHKRGPS